MARPYEMEELLAHAGWLRALAASLVADPATADDLVQDTWVAALRRPPLADTPPRPWLGRVFRNLARNAHRDRDTRGEHESGLREERTSSAPDAIAQEVEAQRVLAEAVGALPEPQRTIVVLRYFRELDSAAIERELGIPAGTVRWKLKQALEELRRELDRRFEGGRKAWALVLGRMLGRASIRCAAASLIATVVAGIACLLVLGGAGAATLHLARSPLEPSGLAVAKAPIAVAEPVRDADALQLDFAPARVPIAATAAEHAGTAGSSSPPGASEARFSGVVLVDGRPPVRPVQLLLEPDSFLITVQPEEGGAFSCSTLPPHWHGLVSTQGTCFASGEEETQLLPPFEGLVLRLRAMPEITGRIIEPESGAPVPGVAVFIAKQIFIADDVLKLDDFAQLACDDDGRFHSPISCASWCQGTLLVEVPGRWRRMIDIQRFRACDGLDLGDITLEPAKELRFRIVDSAGAPLPGGKAWIAGPAQTCRVASCDAEGYGTLACVPLSGARAWFTAPRHARRCLPVSLGALVPVALERASSLDIRLVPAPDQRKFSALVTASKGLFLSDSPATSLETDGVTFHSDSTRIRLSSTGSMRTSGDSFSRRIPIADGQRDDRPGITTYTLPSDGHLLLSELCPDFPFQLEIREDGRVITTRTCSVAPGEWQELEIPIGP